MGREWLADPFTQDALLVQQCVVRVLFALRAMAESRAAESSRSHGSEGPSGMHVHERNAEKKRLNGVMAEVVDEGLRGVRRSRQAGVRRRRDLARSTRS